MTRYRVTRATVIRDSGGAVVEPREVLRWAPSAPDAAKSGARVVFPHLKRARAFEVRALVGAAAPGQNMVYEVARTRPASDLQWARGVALEREIYGRVTVEEVRA